MPTYQYACTACDHRLEAVQSFSDAPLTECPVCQGRLRKLFSAVGIVFKGSGFYRTDSRSGRTGHDSAAPARTPAAVGAATGGTSSGSAATGGSGASSSASTATAGGASSSSSNSTASATAATR